MTDLKIDYAGGDPYAAADHNSENITTNRNSRTLKDGAYISTSFFQSGFGGYVDNGDYLVYISGTSISIFDAQSGNWQATRNTTSDWADVTAIRGFAKIGSYLYLLLCDSSPFVNRVYRYDATDLSSGGTLMTATFFGSNINPEMTSDGTDLFFTSDAGDDATNDHEILRASISGTTLTEEEVITCGSTAGYFDSFAVDDTYIYAADSTSPYYIRKYARSDGSIQYTTEKGVSGIVLYGVEGRILIEYNQYFLALPL